MSKKVFYRQCRYETAYPVEGGTTTSSVAYLPEQFAKVGRVIYFGEERDAPKEELFRVTDVSDVRRSGEWLSFKEGANRNQRKASDI